MIGRVKVLKPSFGFITGPDGTDYFFHDHDLADEFDLQAGDVVNFEAVLPEPAKGPRARQVALREVQP